MTRLTEQFTEGTDRAAVRKPVLPFYGLTFVFPELMKSVRLSSTPPPPLELNKQVKKIKLLSMEAEGV